MDKPYFSIIVVSYNAENLIRATIESVLKQNFDDFEIVVKDACSTDNTLVNIPVDERIRVYSTKDTGIYDGMNQAISYANGEYCTFLNCGDSFYDENVLRSIYDASKNIEDTNTIIYGDLYRDDVYRTQPANISGFYLYRRPLNHQSMFFGKAVFDKVGVYDTNMKISADYGLTVKAFKQGTRFVHCPCVVCTYLSGGVSESKKNIKRKEDEFKQIHQKYFSKSERRKYGFKVFLSMRWLRKIISSDSSPKWIRKAYRYFANIANK